MDSCISAECCGFFWQIARPGALCSKGGGEVASEIITEALIQGRGRVELQVEARAGAESQHEPRL